MIINPDEKVVKKIQNALIKTNGYCPCEIKKTEDNFCPCKKMKEENICICGLYIN